MIGKIGRLLNLRFLELLSKLGKINKIVLMISVVILNLSISLLFSEILFPDSKGGFEYESLIQAFLILVILVPFLETLIFQHFVIRWVFKKFPDNFLLACLSSTFLFSVSHFYSIDYILKTIFSGFLYSTLYLVFFKTKNLSIAYLILAHSIYNLISVIDKF
jgi:hypothetical protein